MKSTFAVIMAVLLFFSTSSALAEEVAVNQWCLELIGAGDVAPSITTVTPEADRAEKIKIALIDSGIRESELRIDNDKILDGKNYVFEEAGTNDLLGHGTAVASIILGAALEEMKIASITEHISVVPLVCFSRYPSGVLQTAEWTVYVRPIVTLWICMAAGSSISSGMDKTTRTEGRSNTRKKGSIYHFSSGATACRLHPKRCFILRHMRQLSVWGL